MTTEERLDRLETELRRVNRRNRWLTGVVVVLVVLGAIWAFAPTARSTKFNELHVTRLVVDGNDGRPRAILNAINDISALVLLDQTGKPRACLNNSHDGPMLTLIDETGNPRVGLFVFKDGPTLRLSDLKGFDRCTLGIWQSPVGNGKAVTYPESSLVLSDSSGNVRWSAP